MKYIDDDMDEMFNRAGRQYPLKTEPKNWDAVHGALHPEQVAASAKKKNGFRRYLPLLLLLLIPAVYIGIDREEINDADGSVKTENNDNNISNETAAKVPAAETDIKKGFSQSNLSNKKELTQQPSTVDNVEKKGNREVKPLSYAPPGEQSLSGVLTEKKKSGYVKGGLSGPPQAGNRLAVNAPVTGMHTLTPVNNIKSGLEFWNNFPPLSEESIKAAHPSKDIAMDKPIRQLAGQNGSGSVPNIDKKKPSDKLGFYYGVTAAPDVSTIKGQNIKGTGYTAGIIAGYQLNRHWSVEAGLLWSKKKYFTDGKYFNKAHAQIPSSVYVTWLDGGCNMLEFPILVRYDFSPRKNTFFGTAGVTSYMMKKEDYKYGAYAGMGSNYYEGHKWYDRSGDHLFSNLQLSAGYKFSLSPKMNMRIEPYLKTPLKKIGIGKMPITSAGLSFGITRDFR